ncbi:hypothetical protein EON65_09060 [archaeon]|nr:MAG: hypothetical protein EON65_09060 [archaeon]
MQILRDRGGGNDAYPLLAAVGGLQLEVVVYRLEHEYNAPCSLEHLSTYSLARWVGGGWDAVDKAENEGRLVGGRVMEDQWGRPVLLLRNTWKLNSLHDEATYLDLQPYALPPSEF